VCRREFAARRLVLWWPGRASSGVHNGPLAAWPGNAARRGRGNRPGRRRASGRRSCLVCLFLLLIGFTALVSPRWRYWAASWSLAGCCFASVHLSSPSTRFSSPKAGPLAAIQAQRRPGAQHLRPSIALIVLTWLILAGMARVWTSWPAVLQSPYGVVLGILGNAYIASGLIAAGMIF